MVFLFQTAQKSSETTYNMWRLGEDGAQKAKDVMNNNIVTSFVGMGRFFEMYQYQKPIENKEYKLEMTADKKNTNADKTYYYTLTDKKAGKDYNFVVNNNIYAGKSHYVLKNYPGEQQLSMPYDDKFLGKRMGASVLLDKETATAMTKAVQLFLGVKVDGKFGKETLTAFNESSKLGFTPVKNLKEYVPQPRDKTSWESVNYLHMTLNKWGAKDQFESAVSTVLNDYDKKISEIKVDAKTHAVSFKYDVGAGKKVDITGESADLAVYNAVAQYQKDHGLKIDGLFGDNTIYATSNGKYGKKA
jgi:murein L,D-transpeptidase YcbB/YkuD